MERSLLYWISGGFRTGSCLPRFGPTYYVVICTFGHFIASAYFYRTNVKHALQTTRNYWHQWLSRSF